MTDWKVFAKHLIPSESSDLDAMFAFVMAGPGAYYNNDINALHDGEKKSKCDQCPFTPVYFYICS